MKPELHTDSPGCGGDAVKPVCAELFQKIMTEQADNYAKTDKALAVLQTKFDGFVELYTARHTVLEKNYQELKEILIGERGIYERIKMSEQVAAQRHDEEKERVDKRLEMLEKDAADKVEKVKAATIGRIEKLENRQMWLSGASGVAGTGVGFVLAWVWQKLTGGHGP